MMATSTRRRALDAAEYRALAQFRYQLRRFLSFSESVLKRARLQPQQYMLLLAIMGLSVGLRPNINTLAERLQLRHHSTCELVDRLEQKGLVRRRRGLKDKREVTVELTARGAAMLRRVAPPHLERLRALAPDMIQALRDFLGRRVRD